MKAKFLIGTGIPFMLAIGCANLHKSSSITTLNRELPIISASIIAGSTKIPESKSPDRSSTRKRHRDSIYSSPFDPKRINAALDKIDRIGDMQSLLIRTQQGYFRAVDSARNRSLRLRGKDSTITNLVSLVLSMKDSMNVRDGRQTTVNKQTLKYLTDSKQAKAYSSMFEKVMTVCAIFVAIVVTLHFIIYLRNGKHQ